MKYLTINLLKNIFAMAVLLFSINGFGACILEEGVQFPAKHGNVQFWQNLIRNSSDTSLAMFWDNSNCAISKGPHYGGNPPPGGDGSTLHITVKDSFRTCHVFNQKDSNLKTLTTCTP